MSKKDAAGPKQVIAVNRRARFEYFIEERYEAGLVLKGWEVKSLRAGRAQIDEAYVVIKNREAWLIGAHFTPLKQTSTHEIADSTRTPQLLPHERELAMLIGKVESPGHPLLPLDLHWEKSHAKLEAGLAKGKKKPAQRDTQTERGQDGRAHYTERGGT